MREQPRIHRARQETLETTAERYLSGLGTKWEDFAGKKVLDVGANIGAFADAAKQRGIEVVSFDINRRDWNRFHRYAQEKTTFMQGDARTLPFADESFEVVVCHAGPLGSGDEGVFKEGYRVLKHGGEVRGGATSFL